jgi:hypothetical protein
LDELKNNHQQVWLPYISKEIQPLTRQKFVLEIYVNEWMGSSARGRGEITKGNANKISLGTLHFGIGK